MDDTLRLQLIKAAVRDRAFLKSSVHDLVPADFPSKEEQIVVTAAVDFYTKYSDPIGGMLRHHAEDIAHQQKLGSEAKKKLAELINLVLGTKLEAVSVRALEDSVKTVRHQAFYEQAIEEIISSHETGKLSARTLEDLVERANRELNASKIQSIDYFANLAKRIERREHFADGKKFPQLLIDELDLKIRAIGRGHTGLWLAPYSSGKGMALVHLDVAYALQSLNVLHITLEDPVDEVEDRLDASISGLLLGKLVKVPNKLKKRFERQRKLIHGRIRIVDGTAEQYTPSKIERCWEQHCAEGFVADVVIVDYDDYVVCEKQFKGESVKRFEMDENYRRFNRFAAKRQIIFWTASQTGRAGEGKKLISGKEASEDINKIRKVFLAIGIGIDPDVENGKYLYVCRHRLDRSRFGVTIVADFARATFYDRAATLALAKKRR